MSSSHTPRSRSVAPASTRAGTRATSGSSSSRAASSRRTTKTPARKLSRGRAPKRSQLQSRLTAGLIIATLVLAAWTIYPVLRLQYKHEREVQTLQAELSGLKTRNAGLREQVEELKTPEGVEAVARETLGLVKPGEQAYVVTGGVASETSGSVLPTKPDARPLWQRALDALFGLD